MSKKYFVLIIVFVLIFSCFFCVNFQQKSSNVFESCFVDDFNMKSVAKINNNFYINNYFDGDISCVFGGNLDISNDLEDAIDGQIDNLKTDELNELLSELGDKEKSVFEGQSFVKKLQEIIQGKGNFDFWEIVKLFLSLFLDNLSGIVPMLAIICAIAILSSLLLQLRGKSLDKSLGDIIHFATFAMIVVLILTCVFELVKLTSQTLNTLKTQMEICFPVLLTLMVGLGAGTSVAIYQPLVAILCGIMIELFSKIVLPIFSISLIFNVIGNLTSSVKFDKLTGFFDSLFKYTIGFVFTIFTGFMAISGISAGSYDGVSIRATKFAIKSYIPIMGGHISDGFSLILASSILIKNAIGYSGLVVMFLTIISPLVKIVLYKLGLQLVSGIIESIADKRITNFVSKTAKSLTMLSSIILAFSFAYLVSVGLIMCTSNAI